MAERSERSVVRTEAAGAGGMVAAKTPQAAEAGAAALRRGGNAIDAAVVAALVSGVVEPWMNGLGGGGYLVAHLADRREAVVVEYPMISPRSATADMFPLAGAGADAALFGWPATAGNANIVGHRAVAVPGTIAGLALALEELGTITLAQALEPAIAIAEEGARVTWHTTLEVARDLANLTRFPATKAIFCDAAGFAPYSISEAAPQRLRQPDLARTLRAIADGGPRAFYEGEIADAIVGHLNDNGAAFTAEEFAGYRATLAPALHASYRGHDIFTIGGGTGGTTLVESLRLLDPLNLASLTHNGPEALHLMAEAFRIAFADRLTYLADPDHVAVPLDSLLSSGYLDERRAAIAPDRRVAVAAGDRGRLGVEHGLAASMPDYAKGGCTTHLSVTDGRGNAVSLTQTLLSLWGSRVTVPGTGVLLNNGMMWFDPEPGRPNSIVGGKRPLSNMAPLIVARNGRAVAAIGSSGGRRIMNANAQIAMNLIDRGLTMQPAVGAPRIDASTPQLLVDSRIADATRNALTALGHDVAVRDENLNFGEFASPACAQIAADGSHRGGVDPNYFPASAVGIGEA